MKRIFILILLFAFDIFAFSKGRNPCVSDAYREYYIIHSINVYTYTAMVRAGIAMPPSCKITS